MNDKIPPVPSAKSLLDYVPWANRSLGDTPAWKLAYLGDYLGADQIRAMGTGPGVHTPPLGTGTTHVEPFKLKG